MLYAFTTATQGSYPASGVIRDSAGNLYGTTAFGGTHRQGNVFKLTLQRKLTTLYSFTGKLDGANPYSGLIRDSAGNLYGTTNLGGLYQNGVVFKLTPTGRLVVVYSFGAQANDGANPSGLIMDTQGNLYGVTTSGGAFNLGTVYKLDTGHNETILYSFTGTNGDGATPSGLVRDSAGNFYGTTFSGGYLNQGTAFELEPDGIESILHTFLGGSDGSNPGNVTADAAGNLYGGTDGPGAGSIFKIDPSGNLTTLFAFDTQDGEYPSGGLTFDKSGNMYGTTLMGGNVYPYGTVFKLDPSGNETVLYNFTGGKDGKYPSVDRLAIDLAGNLYGTTAEGGSGNNGVVFKIKP